jgi:hypothetical protein
MSAAVALLMLLIVNVAFFLVYLNRASAEVLTAAAPVAAGAFSAILLVFTFAKPAPIERAFPVLVLGRQSDLHPIEIPHRPNPRRFRLLFAQWATENASLLSDPARPDGEASPLYHHLLQRAIVDWMSTRYFGTWRIRSERFETGDRTERWGPLPDAATTSKTILTSDDIQRVLGANRFASTQGSHLEEQLALPPRTTMTVQPPSTQSPLGESEIRFKNRLTDLKIRISYASSGLGLGSYDPPGVSQDQAQTEFSQT